MTGWRTTLRGPHRTAGRRDHFHADPGFAQDCLTQHLARRPGRTFDGAWPPKFTARPSFRPRTFDLKGANSDETPRRTRELGIDIHALNFCVMLGINLHADAVTIELQGKTRQQRDCTFEWVGLNTSKDTTSGNRGSLKRMMEPIPTCNACCLLCTTRI